jgi:transcriptional accessory protein Tex/SPT6
VKDVESALKGARHIISEMINEDARVRAEMRLLYHDHASITSKQRSSRASHEDTHDDDEYAEGDEVEGKKPRKKAKKKALNEEEVDPMVYADWFDYTYAPAMRLPAHRVLAMLRGRRDGVLSLTVKPLDHQANALLYHFLINRSYPSHERKWSARATDVESQLIDMITQPLPPQKTDSPAVAQVRFLPPPCSYMSLIIPIVYQFKQLKLAIEEAYKRLSLSLQVRCHC